MFQKRMDDRLKTLFTNLKSFEGSLNTVVSPKVANSTLKTENGYSKFFHNEANPGKRKQVVLPEPPHQEKRCQRAS